MIDPRTYTPPRPRYVRPQRWRPGLKVQHLLFWVHSAARRSSLPYGLASAMGPVISQRQCFLEFGGGARLSIITGRVAGEQYVVSFRGFASHGTFEVMMIRPDRRDSDEEIILNHQDCDDLQGLMDELGRDYGSPKPSAQLCIPQKLSVFQIPNDYYDEEIHGSFLYDDRHNLLKAYRDNRVIIAPQKWRDLISTYTDLNLIVPAEGAVLALNAWCKDNCHAPYAWTGFGPIWAFESSAEAFHFHMTWR